MVKHNNMISNAHFHKDWKKRCRVLFNQEMRKKLRKVKRAKKMRKLLPRPINCLRPMVQCPTERYKAKSRLGRGFSLKEIRAAKLNRNKCRQIGISVDHRRRTNNLNLIRTNVQRLKNYMSRLILSPMNRREELPLLFVDKIKETPKKTKKIIARVPTNDEMKASPFLKRRNLIGMTKKRKKRNIAKCE